MLKPVHSELQWSPKGLVGVFVVILRVFQWLADETVVGRLSDYKQVKKKQKKNISHSGEKTL